MQNYYFSIKNINTHLLLVIKLLNLQKIISYFLILLLYLMKTQKDLGFWKLLRSCGSAPMVLNMRLTCELCRAYAICTPKKPKLRFHSFQKPKSFWVFIRYKSKIKKYDLAYSIQSFLCNAGSVVGYIAPIVLAVFLSNTAPAGEVPATVTGAFYIGAAILLLCVVYTFAKVKEMPPAEYAEFHGIEVSTEKGRKKSESMLGLLVHAPKV